MKVERVAIEKILVKDRYRLDKGDVGELAESIKEKGLIQPITVNSDYRLLAGERRLLASHMAGLTEIDVIFRPGNDPLDALEIELIENVQRKDMTWPEQAKLEKRIYDMRKSANPNWTQRDQAEMMAESKGTANRRLQLAEAMELIPELAEHDTEDGAWKEYKKLEESFVADMLQKKVSPAVKQAARWAADHYHIGDAFEGMAGCNANTAHFAEVDPPYGVALDKRKSRNKGKRAMEEYSEIPGDEFEAFFAKLAGEVYRILRPHSFAVFWYGWDWHFETRNILINAGFGVPTVPAIWAKGNVGQTASPDTTLGSCHEPFWLARKGKPKLHKPGRGNVFDFHPVAPTKKIHPTEKPIAMMSEIIDTCLFPGSAIFVPFLGSGVTLRAAYANGHTGWGYDLSEEHKKAFLRKVYEDVGEADDNPV